MRTTAVTGTVSPGTLAPDDARAHELQHADATAASSRSRLLTSTVCVASSTRGATKVIGIGGDDLAVAVEQLHRQAEAQLRRAIERHLDVGLERLRCRRSS